MTRILAIDPGSNEVGLYWGPGQSTTLYLTDMSLSKSKRAKTPRSHRLGILARKLDGYLRYIQPDFVVYEEQFVRGGAATKALFGAVGVIEAAAFQVNAGVMSVPQSTLRKWAAARATEAQATPKRLYAWVARSFDVTPKTEHELDACVLWHFIQEQGEVG